MSRVKDDEIFQPPALAKQTAEGSVNSQSYDRTTLGSIIPENLKARTSTSAEDVPKVNELSQPAQVPVKPKKEGKLRKKYGNFAAFLDKVIAEEVEVLEEKGNDLKRETKILETEVDLILKDKD